MPQLNWGKPTRDQNIKYMNKILEQFNKLNISEQIYLLNILNEGIKSARELYLDRIGEEDFNKLTEIDPSNNKKYIEWICAQYINGYFISEITDVLELFIKLANKGLLANTDIYNYTTLDDLKNTLSQITDTKTKSEEKKDIKKGANRVFNEDKVLIYNITTSEASDMYGKNTKWCITGKDSLFGFYNKIGVNFYFIINNNYKPTCPLNKIAVAVYNKQAMQEEQGLTDEKILENPLYKKVVYITNNAYFEIYNSINENMLENNFKIYLNKWNIPITLFQPNDYIRLTEADRAELEREKEEIGGDITPVIDNNSINSYDKALIND